MKKLLIVGAAVCILAGIQVNDPLQPAGWSELPIQSKYPRPPASKDALDPWPRIATEMLV
jgi:hypothetical protein